MKNIPPGLTCVDLSLYFHVRSGIAQIIAGRRLVKEYNRSMGGDQMNRSAMDHATSEIITLQIR
jgi:hypothetical protein